MKLATLSGYYPTLHIGLFLSLSSGVMFILWTSTMALTFTIDCDVYGKGLKCCMCLPFY